MKTEVHSADLYLTDKCQVFPLFNFDSHKIIFSELPESTGLFASFLKELGWAPRHSLHGKRDCKFGIEHFKDTKAMTRGNGGNTFIASVKNQA